MYRREGWFSAFLFSRASGWLAVVLLGALTATGWWIKNLQIDAARCVGKEEIRGQLEELTDRVVEDIEEEADEKIRALRQDTETCLDTRLPDAVIDSLRDD